MRRNDILHSISALTEALTSTHMQDSLELVSQRGGNKATALANLNAYSIKASRFDEATRSLIRILELGEVTNPEFWALMITETDIDIIGATYRKVRSAELYLPKFAALLHQKDEADYLGALPEGQRTKEDFDTISVILLEDEKEFSKPERLIELLQSVTELYQGLARMLDESPDSLTVLSCDSGSDKSFDFLGVAKVMEQFKELVVALWDRIVFFGPKRQEAVLDVIIKSLPVLERVSEMEKSDHLGPELAEIIRRQIDGGIRKFVHAGAIIPEIRDHAYHEPRALMSPEKKLLMPPPSTDAPLPLPPPVSPNTGGNSENDAMKEMLARLERMEQQQAKAATKPKPVRRRTKKDS